MYMMMMQKKLLSACPNN